MSGPRPVVVVGGGISGLVTARQLLRSGDKVVLLEGSDRLGGCLHTVRSSDGTALDVGAEALFLGPQGQWLVDELGLRDDMVVADGIRSLLHVRGRLRPVPAGVGPAGPTRVLPVLRSRTMSMRGLLRAGLEPAVARLSAHRTDPTADLGVGEFVTARFGPEVTRTFVDPLLGTLHSGDVDGLSLRATAPALAPLLDEGGSGLLRARRLRRSGSAAPAMRFGVWPEGLARLVETLRVDLGDHARTASPVTSIARDGAGDGYVVRVAATGEIAARSLVLAVPAAAAARLVAPTSPDAAGALAGTPTASVASVLLGFSPEVAAALPAERGTGILVPSARGSLVKAVTFLSAKWPHYAASSTFWVRLACGRHGDARAQTLSDDELVDQARADLGRLTGVTGEPTEVHLARWPGAMPQLVVGHSQRLAATRRALARDLPRVALAGASYDGVGMAACIASARAAAAEVGPG